MANTQNDKKLADARKDYDATELKFRDLARQIDDLRCELEEKRQAVEDLENQRPGARCGTHRPGSGYRGGRTGLFSRAIDTGFGLFETTVIGSAQAAARFSDEVSGFANDLASDWRHNPYRRC